MDKVDRQYIIRKSGLDQKTFATELSVSKALISHVISGSAKSKRVQEHIAKRLNKKVVDLWPS